MLPAQPETKTMTTPTRGGKRHVVVVLVVMSSGTLRRAGCTYLQQPSPVAAAKATPTNITTRTTTTCRLPPRGRVGRWFRFRIAQAAGRWGR